MRCSLKFSLNFLFVFQCLSLHASSTSLEELFDKTISRIQFEMRFFDLLDCVGNTNSAFNVTLEAPDDIAVVKKAKPVGIRRWEINENADLVKSCWDYYLSGYAQRKATITVARKKKSSSLDEKD
ncbi:MAG: hypothetical protein K2X53_05840 [Alphaproteobacteria bacterium]|nr:hypothetical protein [Alphaproteobacteria bacterium]